MKWWMPLLICIPVILAVRFVLPDINIPVPDMGMTTVAAFGAILLMIALWGGRK